MTSGGENNILKLYALQETTRKKFLVVLEDMAAL
jgi:hypothetical protein